MADPNLKEVVLRLERLEEKLGGPRDPKATKLTAREVETYHKVNAALWEDGSCGINETSPCIWKCYVFDAGRLKPVPQICTPCIYECICGPCGIYRQAAGGGWRFGGLGG